MKVTRAVVTASLSVKCRTTGARKVHVSLGSFTRRLNAVALLKDVRRQSTALTTGVCVIQLVGRVAEPRRRLY